MIHRSYEQNISTKKEKKSTDTRIFEAIEDARREKCVEKKESARKKEALGIAMNPVIVKKRKSGLQKKPLFIVIRTADVRGASKRNLLKRRIRTIVRLWLKNKKSINDYTVIVKKGGDVLSFEEIKKNIESQL